jgi:3-phenylpropionate/trans-cinnamate dioxygenase ferredoxin reductase subunit
MTPVEVAIVGNGVAGTACALRLARNGLRPLLLGPGLPVDRPPLSKQALARGEPVLLADEARLTERGVDRVDADVVSADLAARTLVLSTGETLGAQHVVLATGLRYPPPPVAGMEEAHVNATPDGLRRLAAALGAEPARILVVGAGLIGTESAATLAAAGHDVTVIDVTGRPLARLHDPIPELAASALAAAGARFLGGVAVERVEGARVETAAHGVLEADVLVGATGGRLLPPPGLGDVELPLRVDEGMRVPGREGVYAVGDLVAAPHARFGPMLFPHWDQAIGTGDQAADAIAGDAGPYERLPYWWSDIGELRLAEVGLAAAATAWTVEDELHVGRDASGRIAAVLVVDAPRRLREARTLVSEAGA